MKIVLHETLSSKNLVVVFSNFRKYILALFIYLIIEHSRYITSL